MSRMQIDTEDYLGLPIFIICAAVAVGVLDSVIMGFDLGATMIDLGSGHTFSIASIGALATLMYVAGTNDFEFDALSAVQVWIVAATVGLLIAPPFLPLVEETLMAGVGGFVALGLQVGGYMTFSYAG